jgi:hypothetical protein
MRLFSHQIADTKKFCLNLKKIAYIVSILFK